MSFNANLGRSNIKFESGVVFSLFQVRETIKADDDEITKNLMSLATRRPDIFSSTDEEVSTVMANEMNKELVPQAHAIWDGSKGSISHIKHAASRFGTHSDVAAEQRSHQEAKKVGIWVRS